MTPVDWQRISEPQYDAIVSMLLNLLHPGARRIDGSGGDGGMDVQFQDADGLHAFQLKSFTGRLDRGRRRKIKASLAAAAKQHPSDWTVIVPIDPTPEELTWFESLRSTVSFPIEYRGRTWLDAQLASRPYVARYVLEDAANKVARLAELLQQERSVLAGGAPDALARASALVEQLDSLDPFHRYEITVGETSKSIRVIPRYAGALADRPITATLELRFPNDEPGRAAADAFRHAIAFGSGASISPEYVEHASIDAPGQLGGMWEHPTVEIKAHEGEEAKRTLILACESGDGSRLAELPLDFRLRSQGSIGAVWEATDRTGTLNALLTANIEARSFNLRLRVSPVDSYYPSEMLVLVRFLHAFAVPNRFVLCLDDGDRIGQLTDGPAEGWVEPFMLDLVRDLVAIQDAAHMTRRVRAGATREELRDVNVAGALLRGESIGMTWQELTFETGDGPWPGGPESLFHGEWPVRLVTKAPHCVTFDGVVYSLGKRAAVEYLARLGGVARRVEGKVEIDPVPEAWVDAGAVPPATLLALVPGSTDQGRFSLLADDQD